VASSPGNLQAVRIVIGRGPAAEISWRSPREGTQHVTTGYLNEALLARLTNAKIDFEMASSEGLGRWVAILGAVGWLVMLAVVFLVARRQMSGGLTRFGGSPARRLADRQRTVTFADVAGIDEARAELEEVVAFLA
jgi:cell division protease FtsH